MGTKILIIKVHLLAGGFIDNEFTIEHTIIEKKENLTSKQIEHLCNKIYKKINKDRLLHDDVLFYNVTKLNNDDIKQIINDVANEIIKRKNNIIVKFMNDMATQIEKTKNIILEESKNIMWIKPSCRTFKYEKQKLEK